MITCGLDIGSRSVKAVLLSSDEGRLLAACISDTSTDVAADARSLYAKVLDEAGVSNADRIIATGYGRDMAGFADERTAEITCHAVGVLALHPQARTIIDIGGQDSKVIHIGQGATVRDFTMNDRCAAGTGRFLEVVAKILDTDLDGLAELALNAPGKTEISSMCVVFAESEIIGMLSRGTSRALLAAGIHRAIAKKIAGLAERGRFEPPVVFTGGVAKNGALIRALGVELRQRLVIPVDPRITGALGAALLAAQNLGRLCELKEKEIFLHENTPRAASVSSCESVRPECEEEKAHPVYSVPALAHFDRMVQNCIDYAALSRRAGKKIVSIFCEYTPRELILAAGAVPICACGGSHEMAIAGERDLPANLCPLIKSSYGFFIEHANPIFEMSDLVVAETTCDGKKKMYELMGKSKAMHVLELTQKPDQPAAFEHWLNEVRLLKNRLAELAGIEITTKRLRDAVRLMNRERALRRRLASLAAAGLKGTEILEAKSLISCIPEDLAAYERIIAQAEKISRTGDNPRILLTGVPLPHGAEKVIELLEEAGAHVVVQENCTGVKPLLEDVEEQGDPLENIAKKYFHLPCSCMMPNSGRFELIDRLVKEYRPEGIVDLIWQACHTYAVESALLKRHVEDRHQMPFLRLETDYSPSDSSQLRLRIESFLSLIEAQRKTP